jgi:transposase-like protein
VGRPSSYTDEQKAAVYMSLGISDGNVKRATRETGVPEQTVRNWKKSWAEKGPPEGVVTSAEDKVIPGFVEAAVSTRDAALMKIQEMLPQTTVKDLSNLIKVVGILDDKVRMALGLATQRVEHTSALPSPEEMREIGREFAQGAIEASHTREAIIDAEIVEQAIPKRKALTSPLHD